jgi:CxxC motif-containing protein
MKITRRQLRQIIKEEVGKEKNKVQSDVEQAMNKIKGDTRALSDLVSKGEVSVRIEDDVLITVKTEKPLTTRVLRDLPADKIISDIQSDIKNLDVVIQKRAGKGKRIIGNIINPFNPDTRGFDITWKGTW